MAGGRSSSPWPTTGTRRKRTTYCGCDPGEPDRQRRSLPSQPRTALNAGLQPVLLIAGLSAASRFGHNPTSVSGHQYDRAFDNIAKGANRTGGSDANGANLRTLLFVVEGLNRYSGREFPPPADGTETAYVATATNVNGQSVSRKGKYYWTGLARTNGGDSSCMPLSVTAIQGANTNTLATACRIRRRTRLILVAYES